jgi:hypothetical protein
VISRNSASAPTATQHDALRRTRHRSADPPVVGGFTPTVPPRRPGSRSAICC